MLKNLLMTGVVMPFCVEEAGDNSGGGAGGSAGENADDQQDVGGGAADDTTKSSGDAPATYRPDGLPDHYAGDNDQATIDNLFKAVEGYRKKQGEGVPKTADEYLFEEPEDLKGKLLRPGEDGKDPVLERFKPIAHKHGITSEAFQDMALELSKSIMEMGGEGDDDGAAADFEYSEYGGADAAKPVIDGVSTWAQGLKTQGKLDDADIEEIALMSTHSQGLRVLSKLREMTGEKPIPSGQGKASGESEITEEMVNARVSDPRYQIGTTTFDKKFYDETTEMFKQLYN